MEQGSRRRRLREEDAFTLVELLVAMVLALVLGAAIMSFLIVDIDQQNDVSSRAYSARQAESGLQALTRDLQNAMTSLTVNTTSTKSTLSFDLPTQGSDTTPTAVVWTCTNNGTCTRQAGSNAAVVEIEGVKSASFSPSSGTNPAYVGVSLLVEDLSQLDTTRTHAAAGTSCSNGSSSTSQCISLQTGVDLRNFS
ncbi:MAG TPA: prepilin-type N-terminal cleavage/methylation domain-containing protein [Solirubrobacteraceae bacterium]|jgi:prepilin-type N-terminal cleavage/methylation domain-containing protein|nr:prepilin-type N-terminal cleavage/methylation domain-containing protein [Solirubrobacteraceae bacterium]